MSRELPVIKSRQCVRALQRAGFYIDHSTGSHARLLHKAKPTARVTIPMHNQDLPIQTLKSILRQAGLSVEEFKKLL